MTRENAATGKISLARGLALLNTLAWSSSAEGEGVMTMRALLILAAICFSASAFAQTGAPKVGGKPLKQVKPLAPMGCKLVGTVKGTKHAFDLWWEWAEKPVDSMLTVDAEIHDAVMALPPDERRDREKVNEAAREGLR